MSTMEICQFIRAKKITVFYAKEKAKTWTQWSFDITTTTGASSDSSSGPVRAASAAGAPKRVGVGKGWVGVALT